MFKCFMNNNNHNTMSACASASVSASVCPCFANQSANQSANMMILRLKDAAFAVSFFVIARLARIIINEIIISLLALFNFSPVASRA